MSHDLNSKNDSHSGKLQYTHIICLKLYVIRYIFYVFVNTLPTEGILQELMPVFRDLLYVNIETFLVNNIWVTKKDAISCLINNVLRFVVEKFQTAMEASVRDKW